MVFSILEAQEIVIVADKNFSEQNLTKKQIQAIFLDKKRFMQGEQILVMNYEFDYPLRRCFEKTILEKTPRALEKYWRRAYYKGKRPPKVVKSLNMLLSFLKKVQPSIGYLDVNELEDKNVSILYTEECLK
jgi:hypothetical protein